ncbi:NleE/OspZ family T3SS effector cysteine methyltransferase [Pectobacterium parvum]|uniref:NleE/OspZ family T3SS effector cysteine methyltransferase n=1 Tax=Pectobacterium parvum TaxID=2778550 RepID=UPI0021590957|nr:NleE/OspZ family T3SS effector cysteine methyltransferase [Pectobacterium parvum]UVD95616.1 NleE/OspZ family T3SS effector cysteine methyltransferase [Pectobacterium parvum]
MKVSSIKEQLVVLSEYNNSAAIIKKIYPDIRASFFSEKPNVYDQSYIIGSTREAATFKLDGYINKKIAIDSDIKKMYSECLINTDGISPSEANTREGSWGTVISGRRPVGQFSVDSLYSPELHVILELPNIGCKIFPKENNDFLYMIVVYRKNCEQGEKHANRFVELYNEKIELMSALADESHETKVIKSELVIAREMGRILSYLPEEIDNYMHKLNSSALQTSAMPHISDKVKNNSRHTKIIIGCGELHKRKMMDEGTHIGEHLQCDTMDLDPNMGSSILADVTLPLHPQMHNKYNAVMCEGLPPEVYHSDMFYTNLKLMTQNKASFVFSGLTENTKKILTEKLKSHRLNFSETESISDLPQSLFIDEELFWNMRLEYSAEFKKHPPVVANK